MNGTAVSSPTAGAMQDKPGIPTEFLKLDPDLRFVKVKIGQKLPLEKGWQTTSNYNATDPDLLEWIHSGGNWGYFSRDDTNLCVLDADKPDELTDLIDYLGATLTVKSGRAGAGYHILFRCPDLGTQKIYLRNAGGEDVGDIRPGGTERKYQTLGPGSIHPDTGRPYVIVNSCDPAEVDKEELLKVVSKYFTVSKEKQATTPAPGEPRQSLERHKQREGGRDNYLYKMACKLRTYGNDEVAIFRQIMTINQEDCIPPVDVRDLERVCRQAMRHPPGKSKEYRQKPQSEHRAGFRQDLKTLKLTIRVPDDHFITKYVTHWTDRTDAYVDYHYTAALALLSIAADGKIIIPIKNTGDIQANLWIMNLGISSFSRKTTALNGAKIIVGANENYHKAPGMFSTEGLIEHYSEYPRSYLIKDECAQILGSINKKQYLSDLRDVLCELYDCSDIKRKLRTSKKNQQSEFEIVDPYPVFLFATTPGSFQEHCTKLDISSGWLIRFLYTYPRYKKPIKGLEIGTEQDARDLNVIGNEFNKIAGSVSAFNRIKMKPSQEGLVGFNNWFIHKQEEYEAEEEEKSIHSSILSRVLISALKIAALLTLGDSRSMDEFKAHGVEWNAKWQDIQQNKSLEPSFTIPDEYMEEAIRLVDEYFLPVACELITDVSLREADNIQQKIIHYLKEAPEYTLSWSALLRKMKLKSKDFREHIESLEEQEMIIVESIDRRDVVRLI